MRMSTYNKRRKRAAKERKKKAAEKSEKQIRSIRIKPLTSEDELVRTRKEINAINRRRAKEMERRVARFLRGMRVPSSGAIQGMKGDCKIYLADGIQHYYVECKLSSQETKGRPFFPLTMSWFDKVLVDTIAMNARFGILVIHFHGKKQDYVFVPSKAMTFLAMRSSHGFTLDLIRHDSIPRDITKVGDKIRKQIKFYEEDITQAFIDIRGFKTTALLMPSSGVWYVFTLQQFRDLLEGV